MPEVLVLEGASGVGKSTVTLALEARGFRIVGPPVWEAFDEFAAHPEIWAYENQRQAAEATAGVLRLAHAAPLSPQGESSFVVTEASLGRVKLFDRALHELGLLTDAEAEVLSSLHVRLGRSLPANSSTTLLLQCPEVLRRQRVADRGREVGLSPRYLAAQTAVDTAFQKGPTSLVVLDGRPRLTVECCATADEVAIVVEEMLRGRARPRQGLGSR